MRPRNVRTNRVPVLNQHCGSRRAAHGSSASVAFGFGGLLVESAAGKDPPCRLNTHHRRASAGVLDRLFTLKAGLSPMIDVAFAGDVVCGNAVMQ